MLHKAPSKLIVRNGGKGPFAHTLYPVGGINSNAYSTLNVDREQHSHVYLPDDLAIHTPTAEATKPSENSVKKQPPILRETIVSLPPAVSDKKVNANGSTTANGNHVNGTTDNVRNFLKKIPDLSFMLSSKLSSPPRK